MFGWLKKNIGFICIAFVILTLITPSLLTRHGFYCFDFSQTGSIGDTIGGITAPFLGLLSITLLYLTLKEQINFNKIQRSASDLDVLLKLQDRIEKLSNDIRYEVFENQNTSVLTTCNGINDLNKLSGPYYILSDKLDVLLIHLLVIKKTCELFYGISSNSDLDTSIKTSIKDIIDGYYNKIRQFEEAKANNHIHIRLTIDELLSDLLES
ncbi:hypothetical protein [Bacteroides graminisolvens]